MMTDLKLQNRLQKARQAYQPVVPAILQDLTQTTFTKEKIESNKNEKIQSLFPLTFRQPLLRGQKKGTRSRKPLRVGVVFSGGQASGGHNVIMGLFDALKKLSPDSSLFGFLDGPHGIVANKYIELTAERIAPYRNQGGFDLIGSGRTKIETEEQLAMTLSVANQMRLDGLVIIGGDDSNTNAAILAEFFLAKGCSTKVIGVPKTIDGDLKNSYVATSFGFDTACKVYSELIGNIARDAASAKKYYHFIKLMGRSASHIALECALKTQPNLTLIGEEIAAKKMTFEEVTQHIAYLICARAEQGKNYGVILIPEGIVEFIPEIGLLIKELNQLLVSHSSLSVEQVLEKLSSASCRCFVTLPEKIQRQLLLHRDPHGNVQVSLIETELLLIETVSKELEKRQKKGAYVGKFAAVPHFLGYEGRAGFPSNFDCNYCYVLGITSALLIHEEVTGYMAFVSELTKSALEWGIGGIPLTTLMTLEERKGKEKPVIQKALVDLSGPPFTYFQQHREEWKFNDAYLYPGPIQFFGDVALTEQIPLTLVFDRDKS